MTDYIKREDAIEEICKGCNEQYSKEPCEPSDCGIIQRISDIPSADVIEVVRCKDCKHRDTNECPYDTGNYMLAGWDFCSSGERADA